MTFKDATDRIIGACITLEDIAKACGVVEVARARMDPTNPHARPAPPGWEARLAKLLRSRVADLAQLADRLEGGE